jgi:hypothetical protein
MRSPLSAPRTFFALFLDEGAIPDCIIAPRRSVRLILDILLLKIQ